MKKTVLTLLSVWLCLALSSCGLFEIYTTSPAEEESLTGAVTVGISENVGGEYLLFSGGEEGDALIRQLIHGCSTVTESEKGVYTYNKNVVKQMSWTEEPDGSRSYIFELKDNLRFADGQPITAKDYVFGILLQSSSTYGALGGTTDRYAMVEGYREYRTGKSQVFSGVNLLSEYKFSLRIGAENLPYFFEYLALGAEAYPMHALAPDASIAVSQNGAKIDNLSRSGYYSVLTGKESTGPLFTSGPFFFVSGTEKGDAVILQANPYYSLADKASVKLLIVKYGVTDPVSAMTDGLIDVAYGYEEAETVASLQAMALKGELSEFEALSDQYYTLSFDPEKGITADLAVRKAVAYSIDKLALCGAVTGSSLGVMDCFASPDSYLALQMAKYENPGYGYSPLLAKECLGDYKTPTVCLSFEEADIAVATLMKEFLTEAGFTVLEEYPEGESDCGMITLKRQRFVPGALEVEGGDPLLLQKMTRLASTYTEAFASTWVDYQASALQELAAYPLFCATDYSFCSPKVTFHSTIDKSVSPCSLSLVSAK